MTIEVEQVVTKIKNIIFPVEEWGIEKARITGVCMLATMSVAWLCCAIGLKNKPEETILKEKEIR